jgi:hypothetical protein
MAKPTESGEMSAETQHPTHDSTRMRLKQVLLIKLWMTGEVKARKGIERIIGSSAGLKAVHNGGLKGRLQKRRLQSCEGPFICHGQQPLTSAFVDVIR